MEQVVIPLLLVLLALSLVTVTLIGVLWWQHMGLLARVSRLEESQKHLLNHADARLLYERLSSVEGQITANTQITRSVQQHLLDREKQ